MGRARSQPISFEKQNIIPGFVRLVMQFDRDFQDKIKKYPGVFFGPQRDIHDKSWYVPVDLQRRIASEAAQHGWGYPSPIIMPEGLTKDLTGARSWQADYARFVARNGSGGAWMDTGLGKTRSMFLAQKGRMLLAVPPALMRTAIAQINLWWPEASYSAVGVGYDGDPTDKTCDVMIVSYTRLIDCYEELHDKSHGWGTVAFDEAHNLKNPKSKRSAASKQIRIRFPRAQALVATATPQGEDFMEWFTYVDLMWPGRFGGTSKSSGFFKFRERYGILEHNGYGYEIKGLNPVHEAELQERIAETGIRVIKSEAAPEMPALDIVPIWGKAPPQEDWRALAMAFATTEGDASAERGARRDQLLQRHMNLASEPKIQPTVEETILWMEAGCQRILVFGYYQAFCKEVAARLKKAAKENGYTIVMSVGGGADRDKKLAEANAIEGRVVFVVGMAGVWEGINDLDNWPYVVCGESHWSPQRMEQLFGRTCRLGTRQNVTVKLILLENSLDEQIYLATSRKVDQMNPLIKAGSYAASWQKVVDASNAVSTWRDDMASAVLGSISSDWRD